MKSEIKQKSAEIATVLAAVISGDTSNKKIKKAIIYKMVQKILIWIDK